MTRTVTIEPNGQEIPLRYRDGSASFRIDVSFAAADGEAYTYRGWLSPYLPDEMDAPRSRRELTGDVIEAALEGYAAECDADIVRFTRVSILESVEVRNYFGA